MMVSRQVSTTALASLSEILNIEVSERENFPEFVDISQNILQPHLGYRGMEKSMKILVIDDTQVHLDAAKQTLIGHDLTVCSSHDEADKLLSKQYDEKKKKELLTKYEAEGLKFVEYYNRALKETQFPYWDVVLTDLLMPAGSMAQGEEGCKHVGKEMSVGWSLALRAVKEGAKYVAVATDMNHHHHPASAMLDHLYGHIFAVDGAKMHLTNHVGLVGIKGTEHTCEKCGGTGKKESHGKEYKCFSCTDGTVYRKEGKDWGGILNKLLGVEEKEE